MRRSWVSVGLLLLSATLSLASVGNSLLHGQLDFSTLYSAALAQRLGLNPYDVHTLCALANGRPCLPYNYPPPLTLVLLPWAFLPYHLAAVVWTALMLACSVLVGILAARLSGQHPTRMGLVALFAGVLLFSPVRFVLTLGQSDPLEAALALLALLIVARAPVRSGVLGILAMFMKPPTVAVPVVVGLYSRAPRALVGAGLGALAAVALVVTAAAMGHSPGSVEGWLRAALATYRTTPPLPLVVFQLALAALAVIRLAKVRDLILGHPERTFAVAAGLNVLLGTFLHLNPQSMILVVLPLCFVLRPVLATPQMMSGWSLVAVGACCGLLSGDALAAVSHSVGWTHALLPWGTLGLFLAGATVLRPQLLTPALACMATNTLITFPPWYGAAQTEFAAIGSFGLLVLLGIALVRDSRLELSGGRTAAEAT
jgi:Glycosyltransferase family 87